MVYLYNTSTKKAFAADGRMIRNMKVRAVVDDISYIKRITVKEFRAFNQQGK